MKARPIAVNGTVFPSARAAARYIVEQEAKLGYKRKENTVHKELKRCWQWASWYMYERWLVSQVIPNQYIRWIWEDGYTREHNILMYGAHGIRHGEHRPISAEWVDGLPELYGRWTLTELRSTIANALHRKADVTAVLKQLGLDKMPDAMQVMIAFEAEAPGPSAD